MMPVDQVSAALEYAPHSPQQKRHDALRRWARRLLWCALATVTVAVAWRMSKRGYYLYRQHELMTYSAPLGPLEVDATQNDPTRWPAAARELLGKGTNGPVFIHGCRTVDGIERLVVVEELYVDQDTSASRVLQATPYITASALPGTFLWPRLSTVLTHPAMRILSASPDSSDRSHFTITYELNGASGTIDGWLLGEGSVSLEPRDGPLKDPGRPPPADTSDMRTPSSQPT
jgi:hypothetical protein